MVELGVLLKFVDGLGGINFGPAAAGNIKPFLIELGEKNRYWGLILI